MKRRCFLYAASLLPIACTLSARSAPAKVRKMTIDLTPGAVGISGDLPEMIRLAKAHGFESVQPDAGYLARQDAAGIAQAVEQLQKAGLRWGSAGLPVEFRRSEEAFRKDIASLPANAAALQKAGATRIGTWLSPSHNELAYAENLELHARRLRETSRILHDHGLRLGLEYVGTPSLRARSRHPFIYRLSQARELIRAIDVPGTGLVLDSWHWWTAGDTAEDLAKLRKEDVVAVDLNDAPAGVPLAEQQDNRRELPLATGVIPVQPFLQALVDMEYNGPVRAEPFNAPLNQLDNEAAAAQVAQSLTRAMRLVAAP